MFDIIYSYENEVNKATNSKSPGICFTYTPGFFIVCGDFVEIGIET